MSSFSSPATDGKDSDSKQVWVAPKIYPSFNTQNLRAVNRIIKERRLSKSKAKPALPTKPLPTITKLPSVSVTERFHKSLDTITEEVYKPTLPVSNPAQEYLDPEERQEHRQAKALARRQERKKCKFIDDSAIESDGEGGDVPSALSSPDRSKTLKFVNCDLCGLEVSSDLQLEKHRGSKKCRKLRSRGKSIPKCRTCSKVFVSTHDLRRHQLAENH